jgi:hypothetical protein
MPRRWIAALIGAPAVLAALGLTAVEAYRLVRPEAELFGNPPAASLADAIARRHDVERAYAFIRAGHDPNEPIVVNDDEYTGARAVSVMPLMLAVAARDSNIVLMLLNFGARLDLPQNKNATCLARELEDKEIEQIIARYERDTPATCAGRRQDAPTPLLAWIRR